MRNAATSKAQGGLSIRSWMLSVSLLATFPMLALLVVVTLWLQHQQSLQREASLQRQASRAADAVGSALALQQARIGTVAAGVAAREQRLEVLHQVLQAVAAADPAVIAISFVDAQGRRILDNRTPFGHPLPQSGTTELDQRVLSTGVPEVSPLTKGNTSGRLVVGLAMPVHDGQERVVGVLRLVLDPAMLDRQLMRLATSPGWVMAVVDQNAVIVARNQAPEQFRGQRGTDSLIEQLRRAPGEVRHGESRDGRQVLAVVAPVGASGWHVAVGAPEAEVNRAERETLALVVLAGMVVVAASLSASLWVGNRLTQDVRGLASGQAAPARGVRELRHLGRRVEDAEAALNDARHDTLTGLMGRALFAEQAQALMRAQAPEQALGLLYVDLDGFKALNDTQGHHAGDLALAHVGSMLRSVLRPADLAARLGGDEFVVLLQGRGDTVLQTCRQVAERVQADINRHGRGLGCSIGLTKLEAGEPLDAAIARADQAMFAAKRQGRGRIMLA